MRSQDKLDQTFAALSDPTRRAILARLSRGECLLKDLATPFDMTLPAVAKHVKVLEEAGLVARSRDAQRRPCHLVAAPLRDAADWIESYRQFWEAGLDRIDSLLQELQAPAKEQPVAEKRADDHDVHGR